MKEYIHYGHSKFIPEKVCQLSLVSGSKPDRGLWACPVNANFGWKEWCEAEEWLRSDMSVSFKFTLSESARILEVHEEDDILDYVITNRDTFDYLDLPKLYSKFDGVELFLSENWKLHREIFNSWDCDSIVIWNPDIIIVKEDHKST